MRMLVDREASGKIDKYAQEELGIPGLVLMERAALAVVDLVCEKADKYDLKRSAIIFCGNGNNGGDGVACARILSDRNFLVTVIAIQSEKGFSKQTDTELSILENMNFDVRLYPEEAMSGSVIDSFHINEYGFAIDALFGVGLSRDITGCYAEIVKAVNGSDVYKVACDIPSGINADNGQIMGVAVKADATVTMGFDKAGLTVYPGAFHAGEKIIADIGFTPLSATECDDHLYAFDRDKDRDKLFPERREYSNKGTFGRVLVIAGSEDMHGAAYLSALAAYRTGAGLVKIFTVAENRIPLQQLLPEALFTVYDDSPDNEISKDLQNKIKQALDWASVVVIGPGLGRSIRSTSIVRKVLDLAQVPVIIDADAVNVFKESGAAFRENFIFTPHLLEMERLSGILVSESRSDIIKTARDFAEKTGSVIVLKDARTVISGRYRKDEDFATTIVSDSGTNALAKGGSGDVLTGVIAGLVAQGEECFMAAAKGAYIHGLAGEEAEKELGSGGLLARDIANAIPAVMRQDG